jgi:hypothetical protein
LKGVTLTDLSAPSAAPQRDVNCFTRGTLIRTDRGDLPIDELAPGTPVWTLDHGFQPLRWSGASRVPAEGRLAPIRIDAGILGNARPLLVSPQHRLLITGWQAEILFGEAEVLVPAKALVNDRSIRPMEGGVVEYWHMLFDRHEIVLSEGIPTESFHPGQHGFRALSTEARDEIFSLFPHLARHDLAPYGPTARMVTTVQEGQVIAEFVGSALLASRHALLPLDIT